jgi:hypothetical protein
MRALIIASLATCAAACAAVPGGASSSPAPAAPSGPVASLPPQTLAPGSCGLFLFERRAPRRFVVFEDLNARTVQIVHDGEVFMLGVTEQRGALVTGESFRRVYLDPRRNMTFTLTGRVGEETGSGPRLEDVLLIVQTLDGGRVVRPLGGVRSCGDDRD